jgi:hypothetical protein
MLFHMQDAPDGAIIGWVLPDNPTALPRIKVFGPSDFVIELEPNVRQLDLRDKGFHETGEVGFRIDKTNVPAIEQIVSQMEIRESLSNVLLYRRFRPTEHVEGKVFRLELQALPDVKMDEVIKRHFALPYAAVQRFPQDTFFGIANNPIAKSIYLSGRPSFQQYEQLLKERDYKIVTLLRKPYEEMAERLLFARYASKPDAPGFVADHMFGLEPLKDMVKDIQFDDVESLRAAFGRMTEAQRDALTNPLVRTLACLPDERPKSAHVEIALSKLSRMDVVGLRSRYGDFKSILAEALGADVLGDHELPTLQWVQRVADHLSQIKQVRNLISLDLDLYSFAEEAVIEALETPASA